MLRRAGLLGIIVASKSGVRGRGTKEAPLIVQSPRKRLDLGSSGEIQDPFYPGVTSTPSKSRDVPTQKTPVVLQNSSFDADVDVTGSEVTTVGDTSFIVEEGEVTILDNKDDQDSDSYSNTSSDSDDPTFDLNYLGDALRELDEDLDDDSELSTDSEEDMFYREEESGDEISTMGSSGATDKDQSASPSPLQLSVAT
ncbi:hypothetical protein ABFA07_023600 [Porites harrisoni]